MNDFKEIDVRQAQAMINAGRTTVIDIRDEDSYQAAHIQGAQLISEQNIGEFLAKADRNMPLICYCYHGISSRSAAGFMANQGFKDVYSLIGGYEEWHKNYGNL
jgi:thiosulfate sulfurtransferase